MRVRIGLAVAASLLFASHAYAQAPPTGPLLLLLPATPRVAALASAPDFDPRRIAMIRLVFDRTEAGTIVVEHVGLSTPADPAFLASPVR